MIKVREVRVRDLEKGLNEVYNIINPKKLEIPIINYCRASDMVYLAVALSANIPRIMGTGTLYLIAKTNGWLGVIEDVAVDEEYRLLGFGQAIVQYLLEKAEELKCYKVILTCRDEHIGFYQKCGMMKYQNCMAKKF